MTIRRRSVLTLAAGAAALARPALAQGEKRIRLGQSCALTGAATQLGVQMHGGAKVYFDRLNAAGGVNGRSIEIVARDDGYEPDRCKANTEAFVDRDDLFALFGYVGTPTTLAALPVLTAAKMPLVGPFTGAEALREPYNRYVFHVRASYFAETAVIVRQLTSLGQTRIAVFRQNDSYGQAGYDGVVRALKTLNLEPAAVGLVERNSTDVAAAVKAIVPARPHAVVQISAYKSCAAFIRAARKAGYGGTFYNVSFVGTQALADELGPEALGVRISQVMPYPYGTATPIVREFHDAMAAPPPGVTVNYSSIEGYIAAKVFAEGLRRAGGNPTRESLIGGLESLQHWDAGGYMLNFGPREHEGSTFVDMSMLTGDGKVRH